MEMKTTIPNFAGKLLSVSVIGQDHTQGIEAPHWEKQNGRLFLVGTVPRGESTSDWCAGIPCAIAWDQISDYVAFDSVAHYHERLKIYRARKRKKKEK